MVDYSSLENYRTERYRGFESLSLRKEFSISLDFFLFVLSYAYFYFSVTQNQTQISSKTRRILKIAIPKQSKEMLKYVSTRANTR